VCSLNQYSFVFTAHGHPNVRATHRSTLEVTTEPFLTKRGDCILGVSASHSLCSINSAIGWALRQPGSRVVTQFSVSDVTDKVEGFGSPGLILQAPISLVWRTSTHEDDRTVAVRCDKAALSINRRLVNELKNPSAILTVRIVVYASST
jgi:hypothetical protein